MAGLRRLVILAVLLASSVAAAPSEDARRAYDEKQFVDPKGTWADLVNKGGANSYFALGLIFDLGNGVTGNPEMAFLWYKKAAELDLADAQFNVAVMYGAGRGTARDPGASFVWYLLAATHDHHRAQYNLAALYEEGVGTERDMAEARLWYRAAACGGIQAAVAKLKQLSVKDNQCRSK